MLHPGYTCFKAVIESLKTALDMGSFTAEDISGKEVELNSKVDKQNADIAGLSTTLHNLGNRENFWIWRWNMDQASNIGATAGDIANVSAASEKKRGGYLVVSGLRVATLEVGKDFSQKIISEQLSSNKFNSYLVIQQMAAEELAFREDSDIEKSLAAGMSFKIEGLGGQLAADLKKQQIQLAIALRSSLLTSARGRTKRTDLKHESLAELRGHNT